jgi:hypothetical protein
MKKRWSAITRSMWTDDRFLSLSAPKPNAQTLWLYLLTNPHQIAIPGLLPIGPGTIADGLDWSKEDVKSTLAELVEADMVKVCYRPALIFLPKAIHHNQPANPNQLKGWRNGYDNLPDTPLRDLAILALREGLRPSLIHSFDRIFGQAIDRANKRTQTNEVKVVNSTRNGFENRTGNQEQEQEYIVGGPKRVKKRVKSPSEKPASGKAKKAVTPTDLEGTIAESLAIELRDAIGTHSPEYVETKVKSSAVGSWSLVIDKMLRLDKARPEEVREVIRWAHIDDRSGFWQSNLLSAVSLRKQYTRLTIQARKAGRLSRIKGIPAWKSEYGEWAIRVAERSLITSGSLDGASLIASARLEGVPLPSPEDADVIASWAVGRV